MGTISWDGISAGGQVPEPLGRVGNGSLRQRGEQAWDGHLGWVPGAVFLSSFFSNSVQNVFYLQDGIFTGDERAGARGTCQVVLCCSYAKNLKLEEKHQEERKGAKVPR